MTHPLPFGDQLRHWRQRRRMSQLDLACEAEISTRHLSFLETGRAAPSREMVLRLAEHLEAPLRDRNVLLVAAGFAPVYRERPLDDPDMAAARATLQRVLAAHAPFPALAVDRHWNLVAANDAATALMSVEDPALLTPPINVIRLSLHPGGLASRIENLADWRAHVLERLKRQVEVSADPGLAALLEEVAAYPGPPAPRQSAFAGAEVAVPFRFRTDAGVLSFLTMTTIFGTPVDVTLSELAIESFFPADEATARALRGAT